MSEEEIKEEQIQETVEETPQTTEEVQEAPVEEVKEPVKRKDAEYNFAELRKQREEDRKRAEAAEQRLAEVLELSKSLSKNQSKEEKDLIEEELEKLSKDDLATIDNIDKKLYKYNKSASKEVNEVKKELATLKAQIEEQKFRAKYPDIDDVLSSENIAMLKTNDPDMAEAISILPSGSREQAVLAYKVIKSMIPTAKPSVISDDKKRALENSKKPMSVQSISKATPIGVAHAFENGLTKESKAALWKEMEECRKRG